MVLEKTHKSPLDCKEIKSVNPKANQFSIFTGRTDAEAPILRPPDINESLEMTLMLGKVDLSLNVYYYGVSQSWTRLT